MLEGSGLGPVSNSIRSVDMCPLLDMCHHLTGSSTLDLNQVHA